MKNLFNRFVREEEGQDLIEYALLAGFISLAAVGAITAVGTKLNLLYDGVENQVAVRRDRQQGAEAEPAFERFEAQTARTTVVPSAPRREGRSLLR